MFCVSSRDCKSLPFKVTVGVLTPPVVIESYLKLASAKLIVVVGSVDTLLKNIQLPSKWFLTTPVC